MTGQGKTATDEARGLAAEVYEDASDDGLIRLARAIIHLADAIDRIRTASPKPTPAKPKKP